MFLNLSLPIGQTGDARRLFVEQLETVLLSLGALGLLESVESGFESYLADGGANVVAALLPVPFDAGHFD